MVNNPNPMRDYVENFRANLPAGITYDSTIGRYFCNDRRFLNEWEVERYLNYIKKFGFTAFSAYAVANLEPPLVLDFEQEYYRTGGSDTTFGDAITHSRSGNATMVDSDGLLKWAAHNLLTYSEDFAQAVWSTVVGTIIKSTTTGPDGEPALNIVATSNNDLHQQRLISTAGSKFTFRAKANGYDLIRSVPSGSGSTVSVFDLTGSGSVVSAATGVDATIEAIGDGWYLCSTDFKDVFFSGDMRFGPVTSGLTTQSFVGDDVSGVIISQPHLYRSDLGGMVDNPDRGDSYVPTTDSAVYLPRRGHHVYNGTEWVNEGLLHESEARTNLLHTTDALVTQSYTVTAVPHTLHFTGTGTVTLSGASTAGPLVGTGTGENNRVSLTFTPTAASLTLTVSGTVTNAQLEVGSTPSSYIPNLAASGTVTRAADTLTVPSANLPYSSTAMSIQMDGRMTYADTGSSFEGRFYSWEANVLNRITNYLQTTGSFTGRVLFRQSYSGTNDDVASALDSYSPGINVPFNIASRHGSTFINGAVDGTALTANTTPTALPDLSSTDLDLGFDYMGTIRQFRLWADNLGDAGIEEAST